MALYPAAVKRLIPPGDTDPRITPRVAILHVDAGNAASLYDYFKNRSGGVESHFHIRKDGVVEQYRDTDWQADANWHANDFAVSIETQGYGSGEWTPEQMAAIKALLLWLNRTHRIPLVKCPTWDGAGIGHHTLFMDEWAGGPRACPGPDRKRQFDDVIVPWLSNTEEDDLPYTEADLAKLIRENALAARYGSKSAGEILAGAHNNAAAALAAVNALARALGPEVEKAVEKALADSLVNVDVKINGV